MLEIIGEFLFELLILCLPDSLATKRRDKRASKKAKKNAAKKPDKTG